MTTELDILVEDDRWPDTTADLAARACDAALAEVGLAPSAFQISVLLCDDTRIAALNADFRQKGTATNVLSWPSDERGAMADGEAPVPPALPMDAELGDIALAFDTIVREAADTDTPFDDHLTHLIVHGTLHLLGYNHERDADAALMEGLETEILGKLDISDPYL